MKKISCVQMGGPADCKFVVTGNTAAEIVEAGSVHVMAEHPEIMKMMAEMSEEKKQSGLPTLNLNLTQYLRRYRFLCKFDGFVRCLQ